VASHLAGGPEQPDGLPGVALGLLCAEFSHCVLLSGITALTEGRQAARTLWGLAKVYSGMALGTGVGIGIAALLLLSRSR
jgi:hypothetical protein